MAQQGQVGRVATTVKAGDGGYTRVTYHSTHVVTFSDHEVILNSGGWRTQTTKTRMNQASNQFGLGFRVSQRNHDWFVQVPGVGEVPFVDGMAFAR